jgi:hypothetical protein
MYRAMSLLAESPGVEGLVADRFGVLMFGRVFNERLRLPPPEVGTLIVLGIVILKIDTS